MDGQVEDIGIIKRQILDPIAVMNVPVEDEDALGPPGIQSVFGCHRNVIEITESL